MFTHNEIDVNDKNIHNPHLLHFITDYNMYSNSISLQ